MNEKMMKVLEMAKEYYLENGLLYSGSMPFKVIEDELKINVNETRELVEGLQKLGVAKEIYVDTFRVVLSKSIRKQIILENKATFLIKHWIKLHPHQSESYPKFWSELEIRKVFSLKPSYL